MTPTPEQLEAFAPVRWAAQYLTSPDWIVRQRDRGDEPSSDNFNRETLRANDGIQHWLEVLPKHAPGEAVQKTISLVKYGTGLTGFPGACHGGALLTIMDEAIGCIMIANNMTGSIKKSDFDKNGTGQWRESLQKGKALSEVLEGNFVTATLDTKFLKVALCPGVVGVETELLERKEHKMKMRATMKDGQGAAIMQTTSVWVKLRGSAKL